MSALSAIETQAPIAHAQTGSCTTADERHERPLRAVGSARPTSSSAAEENALGREPRTSSIPLPRSQRPGCSPPGQVVIRAVPVNGEWTSSPKRRSAPAPVARTSAAHAVRTGTGTAVAPSRLRLTRRGRLVVGALVVAGVTAALLLITMLASGGAQATNHGPARAGYMGMHQVVVGPGQTLWSIATTAEPTADPRIVIGEIMAANALQGSDISAGQLLWVP